MSLIYYAVLYSNNIIIPSHLDIACGTSSHSAAAVKKNKNLPTESLKSEALLPNSPTISSHHPASPKNKANLLKVTNSSAENRKFHQLAYHLHERTGMKENKWMEYLMETDQCCTQMGIFTEDNGSWGKNKVEGCRSIKMEVLSTKVSGKTISSMAMENCPNLQGPTTRDSSREERKTERVSIMILQKKRCTAKSTKMVCKSNIRRS